MLNGVFKGVAILGATCGQVSHVDLITTGSLNKPDNKYDKYNKYITLILTSKYTLFMYAVVCTVHGQ